MQLFLEPLDVWLFRDGRPFDAGSDHRAHCLFPPSPSVTQGVIRSHELVLKGVDLRDAAAVRGAVGTADDYGRLRQRGPLVARRSGGSLVRYLAVPADVQVKQDGSVERLAAEAVRPGVLTSMGGDLPLLLHSRGEPEKEGKGGWLDEHGLLAALSGGEATALPDAELFEREDRVGIGPCDATRATESEMLYEAEFVRPCPDVGLWLGVEGYEGWPGQGALRLGGEGRAARFEQCRPLGWPGLDLDAALPDGVKLYFATPAYFGEGWRPRDWGAFFEGKVTLEAVALRGYDTIGGYDWAAAKQKPSRRFVPAGSVYYFRAEGGARLRADLTNHAVTDWGGEIGFGQVMAAEWEA